VQLQPSSAILAILCPLTFTSLFFSFEFFFFSFHCMRSVRPQQTGHGPFLQLQLQLARSSILCIVSFSFGFHLISCFSLAFFIYIPLFSLILSPWAFIMHDQLLKACRDATLRILLCAISISLVQ